MLRQKYQLITTVTDKTKKYVGYTLFVDVDGKLEEIDCGSDLESLEELKKYAENRLKERFNKK